MNHKSDYKPDYYAVLGVTEKATAKEIVKAFRNKARVIHPDKNLSADAAPRFIKLKQAYDFLNDNAKRVQYDNERIQTKRDEQRYAQFSAQYNTMAAPRTGNAARSADEEWDALNRGEAYYGQWMKNKFAAQRQQKTQNGNKKRKRGMDESLLREWQQDARAKHERTLAKLKLMWDPNMRTNERTLQNYLWAMCVIHPPNAPPGVAIAEFRTAREALKAEKLCKRFKPSPIRVEWITPRPTTNYAPPSFYYDTEEPSFNSQQSTNETQMDPNLEPEADIGFGIGKKPSFADDVSLNDLSKQFSDVIIIDEMGYNFGAKKRDPIIIDDESSPHVDEEITISDEEATNDNEQCDWQNDDLDFVNQFNKQTKTTKNHKLFEKYEKEIKKDRPRRDRRSPQKYNIDFNVEIRQAKEKKEAESRKKAENLAQEVHLQKQKDEKMKKNRELFNKASHSRDDSRRKKDKRTELRDDFLEEVKKQANIAKQASPEKVPDEIRSEPKSAERIKLDNIAERKPIHELDKMDLKLLFSQKW